MATKARTIKLADLANVIDQAVATSAGRRLPGATIIGRQIQAALAGKINTKALARDVTREAQAAIPDAKLTPRVTTAGGITTIGFVMRPIKQIR